MKRSTSNVQRPTLNKCLKQALAVLAGLGLYVSATVAETSNSPAASRLTYDSFRMVSDKNIFNPNRYARSSGRPTQRPSSQPASRVESFSLVGIMAYEKGTFAFFDGTKSEYKNALQTGGVLGEYKVTQVSPDVVQLMHGTNTFDLKVGMQMRREDEGDWYLSESSDAPRRRVASSTRLRTRGSSTGEMTEDGEMISGSEPEIIVVDGNETENGNGNQNGNGAEASHGNGTNENEPAQADNNTDSGVTDPVLLRLMQRRQQMNR